MRLLILGLVFVAGGIAEVPDALQDLQTEFYLPYSVTEDVDFSITRPGGFGCYQWSTDEEDLVRMQPMVTDYEQMCGSKLEFQVLPNSGKEKATFKITAENVDLNAGYDNQEIPAVIEYTVHIRPVAKLEVLGLKTELVAGSDPAPFGVAGYDEEDNEFDTLDGLQIAWYIGSKREIAMFESHRQIGPIVKVVPLGMGKGAVIAVLSDPNYENLEAAVLEFTVSSSVTIDPDGVYMLEGAVVHMRLLEKARDKSEDAKTITKELDSTSEDADFSFEVKESEIVSLDKKSGNVTGVAVGETTFFVKNNEGEIIKGMPVRVTTAHSLTVTSEPHPESKQLLLGYEYDIKIQLFNKEGRPIYPSENILCKTTFPKQFEILEVAENGLSAKVRTITTGLGKVKANLRSVLTEDDEEIEIVPHVKGSTDFEVYESVVMKPRETILPWDDNVKPVYTLRFKATGGGKVYTYSVDKDDMATVDSEGTATTLATGPGTFKVKAAMAKSAQNFDESEVFILPPTHLELKESIVEFATHSHLPVALQFYTLLPESNAKALFSDCADIPYEVVLSDPENFSVQDRAIRGSNQQFDACTSFRIKALKAGKSCKVAVTYVEPSTGRTLRAHTTVAAYESLTALHPKRSNHLETGKIVLAIGSSSKLIFQGGPRPWHGKPSAHFKQIEVDDKSIIKVEQLGQGESKSDEYNDIHVYEVTCLKLGQTEVTFVIGNTRSATNQLPAVNSAKAVVICNMPANLVVSTRYADGHTGQNLVVNPSKGRIMANKDSDIELVFTVKDKDGKTFDSVESLNIDVQVSDQSVLKPDAQITAQVPFGGLPDVALHAKPTQVLRGQGKEGTVDITAKISGYNQSVLDKNQVSEAPPLPKVVEDDDEDEEDEEAYLEHGHNLLDSVELYLTTSEEIAKVKQKF